LLAAIGDEDLGAIKEGLLLSMEGLELALDPEEGMSVVAVLDDRLGEETPAETLDALRVHEEEAEGEDG